MIKADTHLHSRGSAKVIVGNHITTKLGVLESYIRAEEQYQKAKAKGMDLVTLSDHDVIFEAKRLVELHPEDTFVSCEYWISGRPEGQDPEILVLDVDDDLHKELMEAKKYGIKVFTDMVKSAKKPYALAHPALSVKSNAPRVKVSEIEEWIQYCDVIEAINGCCQRENEIAHIIARYHKKAMCGGSDDHVGLTTALTYTVAPNANTKSEFLQQFREGNMYPEGEYSSIKKAQKEMILTGKQFIADERRKQREIGFFKYFNDDPLRILVALIPLVLPFYLKVAGRRFREMLERRAFALEMEYIQFIRSQYNVQIKDASSGLEAKLENEMNNLLNITRPKNEYISELNTFERFLHFILGKSDSIKSYFESI